ncbi:MAG: hypothetical protein QXD98_03230, partial [Candidatus Diapherotrites archaeon]
VKIGFGFVFLSGIIGHLLGWLAFLLILHKMKIKLFYSVFFLFFPPLIYYSRTLMSETISIALLLLGIYFYILQTKKSLAIAGLLFGLTFWFRITNPIIVLPFFAVLLLKNKNAFFYAMTTFLIPIISLIIFNLLNFGTIDTYSIAGEKNFVNLQNNTMILNYLLVLLVGFLPFLSMQYFLFPFLIFSLNYANEKIKIELILSTILSLIFFGAFQIDSVRYIVPTATLMLIFYPIALENLHKKINKKIEFAKSNSFKAFCVLWFLGLLSVLIISQSNLQETKEVAQKIYFSTTENSLILGNYDVEKFLYQGKGKRSFLKVEEKPSEEKILELKRQFQDIFYISINYEKKKPINIIERLKGKSNYQTEIEKI